MNLILLVAALAIAGPPSTAPAKDGGKPVLVLRNCLIGAIDQVEIPARQAGVLMKLNVRRGDEVQAGQVIGQIDDRDAQQRLAMAKSELQAAKQKSENQLRVKAAELSAAVAEKEHERMKLTNRNQPGAVSTTELERLKLAEEHAVLQIELARRELKLAVIDAAKWNSKLKMAENDVNDRQITAPRDGVIGEVLKDRGEWVQQAEPVMQLVRMDRLRVQAFVSLNDFHPHEIKGAPARLTVHLAHGQSVTYDVNLGDTPADKRFVVNYVSHEVEANGSYRIEAEIDNRRTANGDLWVLQPGMTATLSILRRPGS